MPFEFEKQKIDGVVLVKPQVFGDHRGFFVETYKKTDFVQNGIDANFVQTNHAKVPQHTLRGLYYQPSNTPQAKIVRCVRGEIFDVAVDLRKNSKTYKQWLGTKLSEENKNMLYIPEGFAHGYVVLSNGAEIIFKTTGEDCKNCTIGIKWNDPEIGINWDVSFEPILSEKDENYPLLKEVEEKL